MKIEKNLIKIILFAAVGFAVMDSQNILLKIIEIICLISVTYLILKESKKDIIELKNPSKNKIPKAIERFQKPDGKITFWIMGIIILVSGIFNVKFNFLTGAEGISLPASFQFPFSIVLIFLGLMMISIALIKSSQKISKYVTKKKEFISKLYFYLFIIIIIFIIMSVINPIIWGIIK